MSLSRHSSASSGPVPFRTSNENKYTPSFPSVLYYRDTFGLEPIHENRRCTDSMLTDCSDDTVTTKSTIRTPYNIQTNPMMNESVISKLTQSYHMEQLVTNRVLVRNPRTLLILALLMFATALQLIIFAIISVFFDGGPYFSGVIACAFMIIASLILAAFLRIAPTRTMMKISCIASAAAFIISVGLFFWTAIQISKEDERPSFTDYDVILSRGGDSEDGEEETLGAASAYDISSSNPIVSSTRIAMNSLQLVFAPMHAMAAAAAFYYLTRTWRALNDQSVVRGYFFSEPTIGHQKILVPIELRQVSSMEDDEPDNASIGVQTSGTRSAQRVDL